MGNNNVGEGMKMQDQNLPKTTQPLITKRKFSVGYMPPILPPEPPEPAESEKK